MDSGALFDEEKTHRYILWRIWDEDLSKLLVIGLNPSTANEVDDDNTIKKLIKIAKFNRYGGIYMGNLFPYVTKEPSEIHRSGDINKNDQILFNYGEVSGAVCFAWGNFTQARMRAAQVMKIFPLMKEIFCLWQNKNGTPKHPLYCKDKTLLITFNKFKLHSQ